MTLDLEAKKVLLRKIPHGLFIGGVREEEEGYFRACEEIFRHYDGRPHWGKVNYIGSKEFASIYPHCENWWRVRDQFDPQMIFLNNWAKSIRP